jgi:hypothetical protein
MKSGAERTLERGVSIAGFHVSGGSALLLSVARVARGPSNSKSSGKLVSVGEIRRLKL